MKGQTLIELLVAIGILGIVITSLVAVVIASLGNAQYSKNQIQATQLAQEGLEIVHQWRDGNYQEFHDMLSGTYCLNAGSSTLDNNCPAKVNVNNFFRQVTLTSSGCGANITLVNVKVSWQDGKCTASNPFCHSSQLSTCLSSVNPVPPF